MTVPAAMTATTEFRARSPRHRFGLKGPSAAQWLLAHGLSVPAAPNTWLGEDATGESEPCEGRQVKQERHQEIRDLGSIA